MNVHIVHFSPIIGYFFVESKVVVNSFHLMAQNIQDFDVSKTFSNVVLTTVTGQPDTDGVPTSFLPTRRTGNLPLRNQGRLQDGFGTEIPLVLSQNAIEIETEPSTAYSPIRRADSVGLQASMFISSMIWS